LKSRALDNTAKTVQEDTEEIGRREAIRTEKTEETNEERRREEKRREEKKNKR
jgi:hypothetical protein